MTYINKLTYAIGRCIAETEDTIWIRWETGTISEIKKESEFFRCISTYKQ